MDAEKTREREMLLQRVRNLGRAITEDQRKLWELKKRLAARLSLEDQFAIYLTEYLRNVK